MTVIGEALVAVRPKTDRFEGDLTKGLRPGLSRAEKETTATGTRISSSLGTKMKHTAELIGGAFAVEKIIEFGKGALEAAGAQEKANLKLENSIKGNTKLTEESKAAFDAQALAISRSTAATREQVTGAQSMLASMGLTQNQITKLTPLVIDYARKTGTDVTAAAKIFGRAADGNVNVLHRLGVQFDAAKAKADPFGTTIDALRTKAGGFATQEGATLEGKMAILRNRFDEVKVKVGDALIPILTKLAGFVLDKVVPAISRMTGFFERNKAILQPIAIALGLVVTAFIALSTAAKIYTAVQEALNVVLEANPIGIVIVALAALAIGLIYAYNHSKTFRSIVQAVFKAVADAASFMWNGVIKPVFQFLVDAWFAVAGALVHGAAAAFGWVPGIGGKLKAAARAFDKFRDDVNRALDGIHKNTTVAVDVQINQAVHSGRISAQIGRQASQANRPSGGRVRVGDAVTVGEFGPETLLIGDAGQIVPNNARGHDQQTLAELRSIKGLLTTVGDQVADALDSVGARARGRARAQVAWT